MHIYDRAKCKKCGQCAKGCCYGALTVIGRTITADEAVEEIWKDASYYTNGKGGMTVSGGEPFAQPEFLMELLKKAKEKEINTCIETSGYAPAERIEKTFSYTDLYLFDIKGAFNLSLIHISEPTRPEP